MAWAKIRFYYDNILGTTGSLLTATSAETANPIENIYSTLEVNWWKGSSTTPPQTTTVDLNTAAPRAANYIAIMGHNLATIGASVYLEWSDNGTTWTEAWSDTPTSNNLYLAEFTQTGTHLYWRIRLYKSPGSFSEPPRIAICMFGLKTELDYASSSFDPNAQEAKALTNVSYGGYVTGVHTQYTERTMRLTFEDIDDTLYQKFKTWWEAVGLANFFVGWERTSHAADVYLMRADSKFEAPLVQGGAYRNLSLSLTGRKE